MKSEEQLNQILKQLFDINLADQLDSDDLRDSKKWDSLSHMIFINRVESEFAIELTAEEIVEMVHLSFLKKRVLGHES